MWFFVRSYYPDVRSLGRECGTSDEGISAILEVISWVFVTPFGSYQSAGQFKASAKGYPPALFTRLVATGVTALGAGGWDKSRWVYCL